MPYLSSDTTDFTRKGMKIQKVAITHLTIEIHSQVTRHVVGMEKVAE